MLKGRDFLHWESSLLLNTNPIDHFTFYDKFSVIRITNPNEFGHLVK
ncbi:hypothetical protein FM107_14560 [Sphingobacterium sp. JB170]|nr:hypothetical protein FM107_14560 [Sphingobacterium sp. JB170]